jgi:putative ABC transport system permease protein
VTDLKPFSALKYFKENKKKGLMTFIVLILSICAVSLITVLINSIFETCNNTLLTPFTKFSLASNVSGEFYLNQSVVDKLKADSDIDRLVPCDIDETSISLAIGGNTDVPGVFADKSDIDFFLDKNGDTLKEGRMPENNTNEIAVHWRVMANKHWKIGQEVGNDKDSDEWLTGTYKIVGTLDGPDIALVGTQTSRERQYMKNKLDLSKPIAYAIFPKDGKLEAVNKTLDGFDKSDAVINNYSQMKKIFDKSLSSLDTTMLAIILIVTLILSISVGALMYLIYLQRSDEFGILTAMGYRKGFIYRLIFKEVLSLDLIGWAVGIIFTYFVVDLLNSLVYIPQGTTLDFFTPKVFEYTLAIPLMVALFSILPILTKMRKQDPITIIERRD